MKINEVEKLVGITKKNIRFYEDMGLITPARNEENRYRDYSEADVITLQKIKLLRQLSIPIDEISKLQQGYLTLEDCMRRHRIFLNREADNIKHKMSMCSKIEESKEQLSTLETDKYFQLMKEMEEEGVRFMNVKNVDKKRKAPVVAAIVMIIMMLAFAGIMIWGYIVEPIPVIIIGFLMLIPAGIIVGTVLALRQRIKEIEGGEEDEARKY